MKQLIRFRNLRVLQKIQINPCTQWERTTN